VATSTVLTNVGRGILTARAIATSVGGAAIAPYMGWGASSSATAAATATALALEFTNGVSGPNQIPGYARQAITAVQATTSVANDTLKQTATLSAGGGATGGSTCYEAGSFDASTGGNMLVYATFPVITLNGSDTLTLSLLLQFA
jgi:hypothetical protein